MSLILIGLISQSIIYDKHAHEYFFHSHNTHLRIVEKKISIKFVHNFNMNELKLDVKIFEVAFCVKFSKIKEHQHTKFKCTKNNFHFTKH